MTQRRRWQKPRWAPPALTLVPPAGSQPQRCHENDVAVWLFGLQFFRFAVRISDCWD